MDFSESETVKTVRKVVREFLVREILPLERDVRRAGFVASLPVLARARDRAKETGLFAAFMPKAAGGAGLSLIEFAHMSEELGKSPIGHYVFNCQAPDVGNMELLLKYGSDAQKERYLLPLVRGEIRSCFTMTEPEHAGSNPVWLSTTARKDGDDWVVRGHKWFATGAEGAAFAICMATTTPDAAQPHARASMILVPTDTPGFERIGNLSIMGDRGGDWASHAEISYQDARVPLANLLGGEGMGFLLAQERLGPGRIHHCMRWIGVCERSFDLCARTRPPASWRRASRSARGRWCSSGSPRAAPRSTPRGSWSCTRRGRSSTRASYAAREEISLIKFTVARTMQRVLDRTLQALGGLGMTDDTPIAFWWSHERAARIYDGADEVHIDAVARRILRAYGMKRPD